MRKLLLFLFFTSALMLGCKKESTDDDTTSLKKYYIKFKEDGTDRVLTADESRAYIYSDRTEGTIGETGLNGFALFPASGSGGFTSESKLTGLLNVSMPINTSFSSETQTSAQFYYLNGALFETEDDALNTHPANYVKFTKITFVSSEPSASGTLRYYDVEGEFKCTVSAPSGNKSITNGTFKLNFGIEVI